MKRLQTGKIPIVTTNPTQARLNGRSHITRSAEWKEILDNAYIWFDWASMPQPAAEPKNSTKKEEMAADLTNAVRSIPAYIERSDFVAIVAPGCLHADRRNPKTKLRAKMCFRTWRGRGWCVLEMFASFLSREKQHPVLLIRSSSNAPQWLSSMQTQRLAVGTCNFTCCQRNHVFSGKVVTCDRIITRSILHTMIESKIDHHFQQLDILNARWFVCFKNWWLRGLPEEKEDEDEEEMETDDNNKDDDESAIMINLIKALRWNYNVDSAWFDRSKTSILCYAVVRNNAKEVLQILRSLNDDKTTGFLEMNSKRINSRLSVIPSVGVELSSTALHLAMCYSDSEIVGLLLRYVYLYLGKEPGNLTFCFICISFMLPVCLSLSHTHNTHKYKPTGTVQIQMWKQARV
jgi:hypothetical protein